MVSKEQIRSLLPAVGDKRRERVSGKDSELNRPQACVVVEVNVKKMWYRVHFKAGFCECYKLPRLKPNKTGDVPW